MPSKIDPAMLALAGAIAVHSRHPYSRALAAAVSAAQAPIALDDVSEHPGCGMEARLGGSVLRLGRPEWALSGYQRHGSRWVIRRAVA